MAELNLKKETQEENSILNLSADTVITHESSEEFSLPDYVPEIRRLLNVRTQVLPESKYMSDSQGGTELEFGGTLTYLVIYTNDEGKLCSLPLTSAYDARASLPTRPTTVFIDTTVETTSPRVTAPRKLSIKTRMKSRISGWESLDLEAKIDGKSSADELFMERKTSREKAMSLKAISMTGITASDKLDVSDIKNPMPIWCDASIVINDTKAQNNSVSVRGEITVKCICESQGDIVTVSKSIPLAEEIEAQGASNGDMARVCPRCVSLSVSNEQSTENEQLFFDLVCELEGELIRNGDVTLIRDCYSTKYETEEEYTVADIYRAVRVQNASFSLNESVKRKGKELSEITSIICDPVYEKTDYKNGKAIILGRVNLVVIGRGEGDEAEYVSESYELPYKYALDIGNTGWEIVSKCDVYAKDVQARLEGEKLAVNMQLYPAIMIVERSKQQVLKGATLNKDREIKKDAGSVRVYFPQEGDTLWEIAKKYHTTVSHLRENNDLSTDSTENIKSLII